MSQDYRKNYVSLYGNSDDEEEDGVDDHIHGNKLDLVDKLKFNTNTDTDTNNNNNNNNSLKDIHDKDKNKDKDRNKDKSILSMNNNNNNDFTSNILLEQLAYVDNFLPNVNHDFMNLNSWILNENNQRNTHIKSDNSNNNSNNDISDNLSTNNTSLPSSIFVNNPFMLDEQLAAELSAFADDVFIFPDEDKPKLNNNNNSNNGDSDDDKINNINSANINGNIQNNMNSNSSNTTSSNKNHNNKKKNSHYLSQRRNTFLTSQYDYSKSRCSSKKDNKLISNNNNNNNNNSNNNNTDIEVSTFSPEVTSTTVNQYTDNNANITNTQHIANTSNLTNQISSTSVPLSTTETEIGIETTINNNNNNNNTISQIQVPDYSKMSTEFLVALLPRVTISQSVKDLLIKSGLTNDQIISLSAIMAYHQQHFNNSNRSPVKDYDRAKLLSKINQLHDKNPIKSCSIILLHLADSIESQNNKHVSNLKHTRSHSNKDEIMSLIEASNKEVNELKAKLDKKIIKTQKLKQEMNNLTEKNVVDHPIDSNYLPNNNVYIPDFKPLFHNHNHNRATQTDVLTTSKSQNNKKKRSSPQLGIVHNESDDNKVSQVDSNKKQKKEKELENTIQQLGNLTNSLQSRIQSLESENELLKEFLISFTGEIGGAEKMESIKQKLLKKIRKD